MKRFIFIPVFIIAIAVLTVIARPASSLEKPQAQSVEAYFSPDGGIQKRIIDRIDKAKSSIDIAIYSFTSNKVAKALIKAKKRGVAIRVIMDREQFDDEHSQKNYLEKNEVTIKCLRGKKIPNKAEDDEGTETKFGSMHHKFIIFDGGGDDRLLMTGSYNITESAEKYNYENIIFITDKPIIQTYQKIFETLWNKRK